MASLPDQAEVLCENSDADVEWLLDKFSLDLSLVARLGDHSVPRTHRGKERFPGITITYALIQEVEKSAVKTDRVALDLQVITPRGPSRGKQEGDAEG